jgi:glycosyltransferase involved in cell wall biosynthesis
VTRLYKTSETDAKHDGLRRVILLAPIAPAASANGLAMRTELFRRAAEEMFEVSTVVVPIAGELPEGVPQAPAIVVPPDSAAARAGLVRLAGDAVWRDRLARAGTLPAAARAGSPGLREAIPLVGPAAVHAMRSYLAPLAVALAERLRAPWLTLDLDEDDVALAKRLGETAEAEAYARMLETFGPSFDGLSAASPAEAESIGARHGLRLHVVPNAVDVPSSPQRARGDGVSLLFVGNLTYAPNADAARILVESVLPAVRRRLGPEVRAMLVGPCDARVERLAGPHVEVTGFVPDLRPNYASADAVVVPLRVGGGTRIKLLEAFAHGVPVVASPAAAAGLEVRDETHLLLAEETEGLAAAVERVLGDAALAERLASAARRLVKERYSTRVAVEAARELFRQAAGGDQEMSPRSRRSRNPSSASPRGGVVSP